MGLRRMLPWYGWRWPEPKVPRNDVLAAKLIGISRAGTGGTPTDPNNKAVQTLAERGFVVLFRKAGFSANRNFVRITEAGWEAIWNEDLGAARPKPKSERREKRARHV